MMEVTDTKKDVPGLVKAISVLYYILAICAVIISILGILNVQVNYLLSYISYNIQNFFRFISQSLSLIEFIPLNIIFIIFLFFVARGLWKGRNWARRVVITISAIEIILGIFAGIIPAGLINPLALLFWIIHLPIIGYLLFSKRVKEAFS